MSFIKHLKYNKILILFALFLILTGCSREPILEPEEELTELPEDKETQIKDFVWNAMNSWYLYQEDQPLLNDARNDHIPDYAALLNAYSSPEAFFDGLLYKPNVKDKFSFIVDDYTALQNELQGISEDFGFDYQLVRFSSSNNDLIGYVRYVLPGTPAYEAGIRRGDLFGKVNGTQLTISNYQELLFNKKAYDLGLVKLNDGNFVQGNTVPMTAAIVHENPVFKSEILISNSGVTVGYLVLNGFNHLYHSELNQAFTKFRNNNVGELVLDLRYNPGGSVITAATLASMIFSDDPGKRFITFDYNSKHEELDNPLNFLNKVYKFNEDFEVTGTEPLTSLGLKRLFVLTSSATASASEAIINGLNPYMDVVVIGETTVGKNVGSRTLYDTPDSDYAAKPQGNQLHTYALQPLTTKIVNSAGFGEYENGFEPDIELSELDYIVDLKPLGSLDEPLLHAALEYLSPTRSSRQITKNFDGSSMKLVAERKSENPFYRSLTVDGVYKINPN